MLRSERGNVVLKFLDRWIGIPLVIILSLFRRRRSQPPQNPKRIGILIPAAIGDTIVASPIFDALKSRYPQAEIIAFASSSNLAIFELLGSLTRVVNLPIKNPLKALRILRHEGRFDWWIDCGQWARLNALYSFFAKAEFKIGFQTPHQHRHYIYDQTVSHSASVHESQNFDQLLSPFHMQSTQKAQLVAPNADKKKQILIHIFAGGSKPYLKEWPLENWKALVDQLTERSYQVILTGVSENKIEADKLITTLKHQDRITNAVGIWKLPQVAQEMRASQLVISVNTGVMHLASALNCNLVSLQGPTSVKRWGPTNSNVNAIQSPLSCSPCLNLGFEYGCPYNNCMKAITVQSVADAANTLLPPEARG